MSTIIAGTGLARTLQDFAKRQDAAVRVTRTEDGEWLVSLEWGREAPDSPMVGAAALGCDPDLPAAIEQALADARIKPCALCGWEQTCEEGCKP